jgi:hypothetical protein
MNSLFLCFLKKIPYLLHLFQCCGSRMFIPNPGPRIPEQQQKRKGEKSLLPEKYLKIKNCYFGTGTENIFWANLQRIITLCTSKIVIKLSKIWVWDPGSRIPDPKPTGIPDSGVKKAPDHEFGCTTLIYFHLIACLISENHAASLEKIFLSASI